MGESQDGRGANKRTTLVEEGTAFKGTFSSDCPIVIKGRIEGDVTGPSLTVSATGSVAGTVKVGMIESDGELSGTFEADVVRLSGRVRDNTVIRAKSLEVKLAPDRGMMQVIFGECGLEVGDMPSKEDAIAAAQTKMPSVPPAAEAPVMERARTSERPSQRMMAVPESDANAADSSDADERPEQKNGAKGKTRSGTLPPPAF